MNSSLLCVGSFEILSGLGKSGHVYFLSPALKLCNRQFR